MAPRTLSERPPAILAIDDLDDDAVDAILAAARVWRDRGKSKAGGCRFSLGLLFLEDSLRTRIGFAEAALRLGGSSINVLAKRDSAAMTAPESFADTVRTLSGMVDLVVARTPFDQQRAELLPCLVAPFVNGGDGGVAAEHPSQALIDLFAISPEGRVDDLRIGLCGDLRSRAARSTAKLLARREPAELRFISPPSRAADQALRAAAPAASHHREMAVDGLDVLLMCGLPERRGDDRLDAPMRARFTLTGAALDVLPRECPVYSPMPVVDEIGPDARRDPRLKMFGQSDEAVAVRTALLEHLLGAAN